MSRETTIIIIIISATKNREHKVTVVKSVELPSVKIVKSLGRVKEHIE
jgi:hypothetical protein